VLDIASKETAEDLDEPDSMQALEQVSGDVIDVVDTTSKIRLVRKRKSVSYLLTFEFTNFNLGISFTVG
jgi:hypothetical protein